MADRSEVDRLRAVQRRREQQEVQSVEQAADPTERRTHERRAEKAAYLREKLDQQAQKPDA